MKSLFLITSILAIFLFLFVFTNTYLKPETNNATIIITHGANASESTWFQPGGDFFNIIEQEVSTLFNITTLVPFVWEQPINGVSCQELLLGATKLANQIIDCLKFDFTQDIILIGHSYGGYIIKLASQLLNKNQTTFALEKLTTDEQIISIPQSEEITLYKAIHKDIQKKKSTVAIQKNYIIDSVYTLGTPNIHSPDFQADMTIVGRLFNLYSDGDFIQDSIANKTVPAHDRKVNLKVIFKQKDGALYHPNHEKLHDACIGHWLLQIPELFKEERPWCDIFTFKNNGILTFDEMMIAAPTYKINKKPVKEKCSWSCAPIKIPCLLG